MPDYHIRLHMSYTDASNAKVISYISDRSDEFVVCQHDPGTETGLRDHIHGYIRGCSVNRKTFNAQLTRLGAPSGNEGRMLSETYGKKPNIKPIDKGLITYISKGKLDPSYIKGVEISEFNFLRSNWIDYKSNSGLQGQQGGSGKKSKKLVKTDFEIYCEIAEIMKDYSYECSCDRCTPVRYIDPGQTCFPKPLVRWGFDRRHQHIQALYDVLLNTRKKYGKQTSKRLFTDFAYMFYNDGGRVYDNDNLWEIYDMSNPTQNNF